METTLSAVATTTSLFTLSKTLNPALHPFIYRLHRHFYKPPLSHCLRSQLISSKVKSSCNYGNSYGWRGVAPFPGSSLRSLCAVLPPVPSGLRCSSNYTASFTSGGGGSDDGGLGGGKGGGGGDGGFDGRAVKANSVAVGAEEVSATSPDVIILDVGGMTCGGCAASVKRILENQPQVSSASVNLTTETAVVWPVSEAMASPNWQQQLGETLAKHLTSCGFKSNLRGQGAMEGDFPS